ncbi:MAG: SHOCT domain-containing protein [Trebonia sp.]
MMRRRRPLLRAAAVGGGAYMVGKHNANRQAEQSQYQQDQDDRISNLEAQQQPSYQQAPPAAAPAPTPAAAPSPMIDQLNQLAALHQQGVLSDEEFAAAKAKLLGT